MLGFYRTLSLQNQRLIPVKYDRSLVSLSGFQRPVKAWGSRRLSTISQFVVVKNGSAATSVLSASEYG